MTLPRENEPPVSIILRSYDEAWALCETLPALRAQNYRNWELIAFDSGSSDQSVELIRSFGPRHFVQLLPHDYRPGRILNQGMRLASHDRVVFLNADATPRGPDWLGPLVAALDSPRVAAVYGRQVPRPGCRPVFASDYERCFAAGPKGDPRRHFFSMASSALRRDVWARRGFNELMQYSEDDEYARWCRAEGYDVRYCPDSVVVHSHNYSPRQAYKRGFGEAWALACVWPGGGRDFNLVRTLFLGWLRDAMRDLLYCGRRGQIEGWPHALAIRWNQRLGRLHGFRAGWRMHRVDRVL